jgi:hypothetical protein
MSINSSIYEGAYEFLFSGDLENAHCRALKILKDLSAVPSDCITTAFS